MLLCVKINFLLFFVALRYKGASGSSAVCAFTMAQVERAFSGRYREVNRETQQWYTYNHPVPEPRPGAVSREASVAPPLFPQAVCHYMMEAVLWNHKHIELCSFLGRGAFPMTAAHDWSKLSVNKLQ